MKIINSIISCYNEQLEQNEALKDKVDTIFHNNKPQRWHYFSRIKSQESFALKIETGRVKIPHLLEDFFGCSIVVENSTQINEAEQLVQDFFQIENRRPKDASHTHKSPDAFPYDDLRLYVKLKQQDDLPPDNPTNAVLSKIIFEIQIKTYLQHAWNIATHDLIYKGEDTSWAKRRVAYQIKAMLEHAELSIKEIEKIKESEILSKTNDELERLNQVRAFLLKKWSRDSLPEDITRLSDNIDELMRAMELDLITLEFILDSETKIGKGTQTQNLPPYFIILQSIINQRPKCFLEFNTSRKKFMIALPPEIETNMVPMNENKIIRIK